MSHPLSSTFGMSEMEDAAYRLIQICRKKGSWCAPTSYRDMIDAGEQAGFIQLVYCQMLRCAYYKNPFYATQKFIDRIPRSVLGDLPTIAPTSDELFDAQIPLKLKPRPVVVLADKPLVEHDWEPPPGGNIWKCRRCGVCMSFDGPGTLLEHPNYVVPKGEGWSSYLGDPLKGGTHRDCDMEFEVRKLEALDPDHPLHPDNQKKWLPHTTRIDNLISGLSLIRSKARHISFYNSLGDMQVAADLNQDDVDKLNSLGWTADASGATFTEGDASEEKDYRAWSIKEGAVPFKIGVP